MTRIVSEPAVFPELVTARMIRDETGLPEHTVRAIITRAVRSGDAKPIKTIKTVLFRRDELAPYFDATRER